MSTRRSVHAPGAQIGAKEMSKIDEIRAKARAQKAAAAAAAAEAAPPADADANANADQELPPGIDPESFARMPAAVQAAVLRGQANAVNPPEVVDGLEKSVAKSDQVATGEIPDEAPAKKTRGKKTPAATATAPVDLAPVVEAIKALPAPAPVDLAPVVEALEKQRELLELIAEILAGGAGE